MPELLAVAHDAGGAEIVSCWIEKYWKSPVKYLLEGPAVQIFQRNLGVSIDVITRDEFLTNPRIFPMVLTGTSWANDLEKIVHRVCTTAKIKCIAYLDHWVGYPERFTLNGQEELPDEIWVGDSYAQSMARKCFPNRELKLVPNAYMQKAVREIQNTRSEQPKAVEGENILYCTEPTSVVAEKKTGNPEAFGYTEFSAIEGLVQFLKIKAVRVNELRVRPHPSEKPEKYAAIVDKYRNDFNIRISAPKKTTADCAWADIVVGCDSMVMAIAASAGKRVLCAIPAGGKALTIPLPGIERIFEA